MRIFDRLRRKAPEAPPVPPIGIPAFVPLPDPAAEDPLLAFALALAPGRRCILTGDDAQRLARFWLALRREGAELALVVTADPPADADDILRDEAARWALVEIAAPMLQHPLGGQRSLGGGYFQNCDLPPDWWVKGALDDHASRVDLAIDLRPLAQNADPLSRLTTLAATRARDLLLDAGTVEVAAHLARVGFRLHRQKGPLILGRRA
ncbi:MAG: hypothetical protein JWR10_2698 [Rubritepida sp.]|nr:hypothetical protein [Rubritepida sp.]